MVTRDKKRDVVINRYRGAVEYLKTMVREVMRGCEGQGAKA